MSILALLLLFAAGIIFFLRTFWVVSTRVHLVALGLVLFVAYLFAQHFTTATIGH